MDPVGAVFRPFAPHPETIRVGRELAAQAGLQAWAAQFKLGTAGYRDLLNPQDMHDLSVPFNSLTVAIMLAARAQLARKEGLGRLHVGGEVRPHTQEFIDLAARIYAAAGLEVHLRPPGHPTTPIWLSSFGVFHEELDGGENFTASHSQSYKGGWKPMDKSGGQLLELADRIADRVRALVAQALSGGLEIPLAGSDDPRIRRDFDPINPYVAVLRQVVGADLLGEIPRASAAGFRAAFCTEGGSMGDTGRRVLGAIGITVEPTSTNRDERGSAGRGAAGQAAAGQDLAPVFFTHEEESSNYHGIGIVDGVDHGVDPGKWQVYKNVGAQEILRDRQAEVFFIWDPDGDRFNMVTTASAPLARTAREAGLEVDPLDDARCLVCFKPNQIYFMLTAARIASLQQLGWLGRYDWIVATTFPTSRSITELAGTHNAQGRGRLKTYRVPVGFKHFAALVRDLERQLARKEGALALDPAAAAAQRATAGETVEDISATDVTGQRTVFGPRPRLLIMAEESGGAAMGPAEAITSRTGRRWSLAPKEKDAMQIGVAALTLAARLYNRQSSFAAYYLELLDQYAIVHRFYERRDVTLFDESLQGSRREAARRLGNARKQATVAFFADLEGKSAAEVSRALGGRLSGLAALPEVERASHAGDGTLIEFADQWFQLRASGTDAVLRYYMEGRDRGSVTGLNEAMTRLRIDEAAPGL